MGAANTREGREIPPGFGFLCIFDLFDWMKEQRLIYLINFINEIFGNVTTM